MLINLDKYQGTVGTFNNPDIAPKKRYSLLTCKFFYNLNWNIIFFVVTLILLLSSILTNNFKANIIIIHWPVLETFLIVINIYSIFMGTALLIRNSGDIEKNPGSSSNPRLSLSICLVSLLI